MSNTRGGARRQYNGRKEANANRVQQNQQNQQNQKIQEVLWLELQTLLHQQQQQQQQQLQQQQYQQQQEQLLLSADPTEILNIVKKSKLQNIEKAITESPEMMELMDDKTLCAIFAMKEEDRIREENQRQFVDSVLCKLDIMNRK